MVGKGVPGTHRADASQNPPLSHNQSDLESELTALRERIAALENRCSLVESSMHPWVSKNRELRLYDWDEFVGDVVADWQERSESGR